MNAAKKVVKVRGQRSRSYAIKSSCRRGFLCTFGRCGVEGDHWFSTVRLHVMQRTVLPRPFCLSVCLSVKRVQTKTETCTHILIPHERSFILVFWREEWLVGRTWNFGSSWPCWSENVDFQSIFARSASSRNT